MGRSIPGLPNLVAYYGYVYCFTSYLAGPAFGIREYLDVCEGHKWSAGEKVPGRVFAAIKVAVMSFVFLGAMMWGTANFPMVRVFNAEWLAENAYASPQGWLWHCVCMWLALFFIRCKYYFGWLLAEGSSIISGFGYSVRGSLEGCV